MENDVTVIRSVKYCEIIDSLSTREKVFKKKKPHRYNNYIEDVPHKNIK